MGAFVLPMLLVLLIFDASFSGACVGGLFPVGNQTHFPFSYYYCHYYCHYYCYYYCHYYCYYYCYYCYYCYYYCY